MSSLRLVGALITDTVALYFCAVFIIAPSELGRHSDRVLIGHVWQIHSFTVVRGTSGFCCALWYTSSFATHAQSGLSGPGFHHLLSQPIFIASYLSFTLGGPIPPRT